MCLKLHTFIKIMVYHKQVSEYIFISSSNYTFS